MNRLVRRALPVLLTAIATSPTAKTVAAAAATAATAATVIEPTQVPCPILGAEGGVDHGYRSHAIADCEAINARTAAARLARARPLKRPAGDYVFRVTNRSVPYDLGFWLRGDGAVNRVRLPGTSGGGLTTGKTQDYAVTLKPGEYVYSCPLNNTPDDELIVR